MAESCATCKRRLALQRLDYSKGGCEHTDMEGYICLAFAGEGVASWMVGIDANSEQCEVYEPKEDN